MIEITMLSTTLVIVKVSVGNIGSMQGVSQILSKNRSKLFQL